MTSDLPPWIGVALNEYGVSELPGDLNNSRIIDYHNATLNKFTTDQTPWCSAFVNWVMRECGYQRTSKALAKSWLEYGEHSSEYIPWSIVVLRRGQEWQGHVGFAISLTKDSLYVLGGNQNNSVSIMAYDSIDVLSYRRLSEAQKLGSL